MKVSVEVVNKQRKLRVSLKRVMGRIKKIVRFLYIGKDKKLLEITGKNTAVLLISVILLGEKSMKKLNFRYRGKNSTTDVLSFPYLEREPSGSLFLGEIVIDPAKVLSQAKQYNVRFSQELDRILTHGVLHLLGYDHERSAYEARRMRKLEEKILAQLQP